MKILLTALAVCIASFSGCEGGWWWWQPRTTEATTAPWYHFWKPHANKTNKIINYFYCRLWNFTLYYDDHEDQFIAAVKRLWLVYRKWLYPIETTTTARTTTTTNSPTTTKPRGRPRANALITAIEEKPYVPRPPRTYKPRTRPCKQGGASLYGKQ